MGKRWNDERRALLRGLWLSGLTAQAIADHLGDVSRSAVMGKIFRLRRELARAAQSAGAGELSPARRHRSPNDFVAHSEHGATRRGKSLLELTNHSCRWPHGSPGSARFFYCGASGADLEAGMPYCPLHARRAFRGYECPALSPEETDAKPHAAAATAPPARHRYVWRGQVRHPAPRWR